jgi:hypothetical protein
MKTHTQQQTNLEIETTATEPKLSHRKRSEYKPRKWRGNTLVPVIIALAISAIATIAFLTQGANLAESNKVVVAQNEISSFIADWTVAKEAYSGSRSSIPNMYPASNVTYGLRVAYIAPTDDAITTTATLEYDTDSASSCNELRGKISITVPEVSAVNCVTNAAQANAVNSRLSVTLL